MTDRIEKAYYLKQEELAVLLTMNGVRQLYGFRMDTDVDMDREKLNKILFEMNRKNILSVSENHIRMDEDLSAVLKDLAQAETVLILTGTEEYPECCIYAGQNLIFVHLLGHSGQIYRIEPVEKKEACSKMREYGFLVPGVLEKRQAYLGDGEAQEEHLQIKELARKLYGQEKDNIMRQEEVRCCLAQYSVLQTKKVRQLLIINGGLEDYLACSDKAKDLVYVYSDEKANELLTQMMGGFL